MTPLNCTFDPLRFPYQYDNVTQGTSITINQPNQQPIQLCIFNSTQCVSSATKCCQETDLVQNATSLSFLPPLVTFMVGYVSIIFLFKRLKLMDKWHVTGGMGLAALNTTKQSTELKEKLNNMTSLNKKIFYVGMFCVGLVWMLSIFAMVAEAVIMPKSIQETLSPSDRTAQLAMSSFLTPVEEIFSFLEDTMTVKVGYAVAALNYSELNALLHIGILGGIVSGIIAFLLTTFIALYHGTAEAILNPSHTSNQILIEGGCSLIPTTAEICKVEFSSHSLL